MVTADEMIKRNISSICVHTEYLQYFSVSLCKQLQLKIMFAKSAKLQPDCRKCICCWSHVDKHL